MFRQHLMALLATVAFGSSSLSGALAFDARVRLLDSDVIYQQQNDSRGSRGIHQVSGRSALGGGLIEHLFSGGAPVQSRTVEQYAPPNYQNDGAESRRPYVHRYEMNHEPGDRFYREAPARAAIDPRYMKQSVPYNGREPAGTIIIDTPNKFLFLVQEDGTALRYGVGVGRPGFTWSGVKKVTAKKEWPSWVPPKEMLARRPDLPRFMEGGPDNPLGARALYLGTSLYRIHGSNEPWTIGTNVSSGCIRMRNEDVIDLYGRVRVGTKVVVI